MPFSEYSGKYLMRDTLRRCPRQALATPGNPPTRNPSRRRGERVCYPGSATTTEDDLRRRDRPGTTPTGVSRESLVHLAPLGRIPRTSGRTRHARAVLRLVLHGHRGSTVRRRARDLAGTPPLGGIPRLGYCAVGLRRASSTSRIGVPPRRRAVHPRALPLLRSGVTPPPSIAGHPPRTPRTIRCSALRQRCGRDDPVVVTTRGRPQLEGVRRCHARNGNS